MPSALTVPRVLEVEQVKYLTVHILCFAAMSIYMLLVFENETGIASVCVLSSGILVLLIIVAHSLARAARTARQYHSEHPHAMYQNEPESSPSAHPPELGHMDKARAQRSQSILQRQMSYPPCPNVKQKQPQQYAPSSGTPSHASDKESYGGGGGAAAPRMHRTLSAESGLLHSPSKPWNGINSEMRTVLARKSGAIGKDSTLV